jgi:hypothetical protein
MAADYPENGQTSKHRGDSIFSNGVFDNTRAMFCWLFLVVPTFPAAPGSEGVAGLISCPEIFTGPLFSGLARCRIPEVFGFAPV